MSVQTFVFSAIVSLLFISAFMVFWVKNSVYSVLYLISCFVLSAGLFILMGAEFLGLSVAVAYVGAVAVFFLFVVMMLDVDRFNLSDCTPLPKHGHSTSSVVYFLPIVAFFVVFLTELLMVAAYYYQFQKDRIVPMSEEFPKALTRHIGEALYSSHSYPLQLAGVVLFIAMVGAIVLTIGQTGAQELGLKKYSQSGLPSVDATHPQDVLKLLQIKPGEGLVVVSPPVQPGLGEERPHE